MEKKLKNLSRESKRVALMMITIILTMTLGKIEFQEQSGIKHTETWYNLPMSKVMERAKRNGIEGSYWEREDGCKMWGPWIICAGATDRYGEVLETSLGYGMILDTGDFALDDPEQIDIAVTWQKGKK